MYVDIKIFTSLTCKKHISKVLFFSSILYKTRLKIMWSFINENELKESWWHVLQVYSRARVVACEKSHLFQRILQEARGFSLLKL